MPDQIIIHRHIQTVVTVLTAAILLLGVAVAFPASECNIVEAAGDSLPGNQVESWQLGRRGTYQVPEDYHGMVCMIESLMPNMEYEELIIASSLVISGTVTDQSEEHLISNINGGDAGCFTDVYVSVSEVYRGEVKDNVIVVRVAGGSKSLNDDYVTYAPSEASLFPGDEVVLFLQKPKFGDSYITRGDYYLTVSALRGVFYRDTDGVYHSQCFDKVIELSAFQLEMAAMNSEYPIDDNYYLNYFRQGIRSNYESGVIPEDQYQNGIDALGKFAEIIK
ncbi:MAG: hypothetical protein LBU61_01175 [Coriobacteriales bacterium]|jgi:hypothetical protein|nr:hypothetical protein [Coriobacteriales bacterium]